jgi:hypothetical protein
MDDATGKTETAPRTRRFLRELTGSEAHPWARYPDRAEIEEHMRRARVERSLAVGRILVAMAEAVGNALRRLVTR